MWFNTYTFAVFLVVVFGSYWVLPPRGRQLFLLAAIKERYDATGDTMVATREGIARTGRPITNAALIMIVVFVAFGVTGPIPPTELGVTLALAVALDATVIRMLLVPALFGLLGDKSWWLPRWLDRLLPHVRFSH